MPPLFWVFFYCLLSCEPSRAFPRLFLLCVCFLVSFSLQFLYYARSSHVFRLFWRYQTSHIQNSILYLQLKYYKVLLPFSGKSFLLSHCSHILVSPWRVRELSRRKTHKYKKMHMQEKTGCTFLSVPPSCVRWPTSLLFNMSARQWPSTRTLPVGSTHSKCVFLDYNFSRDLILQV